MTPLGYKLLLAAGVLALVAGLLWLYGGAREHEGALKQVVRSEQAHAHAVAVAHADSAKAATEAARIADATIAAVTDSRAAETATMEDIRNATDPAPGGDAAGLPAAAPELRDDINAAIARSERAADLADAAGGTDAPRAP